MRLVGHTDITVTYRVYDEEKKRVIQETNLHFVKENTGNNQIQVNATFDELEENEQSSNTEIRLSNTLFDCLPNISTQSSFVKYIKRYILNYIILKDYE